MQQPPLKFKKILFPVDFSPLSGQTAGFVREIAHHYQSQVHLLHILNPFSAATAKLQAVIQLKEFYPEYWEDLDCRHVVVEGDPSEKILSYVQENDIEMIMMPTAGHKVLQDAHCHVWTDSRFTQDAAKESTVPRHVLCAVDLSPHSVELIAWTMAFAKQWNAEVRLAHAVPASPRDEGRDDESVEESRRSLAKLQHRLRINLGASVHGGDVQSVVRDAAKRHQADVIVVGGAASHIVREAPCPVIRM